jgi:rhamnosyltransferase
MTTAVPRVCLAISAYRSDESILRLLEQAMSIAEPPFQHVLVVDSLGSGRIPETIEARGWQERVEYRSYPTNLGSAGNLWKRLQLPCEQGFDFVYAINHDGLIDPELIAKLLAQAQRMTKPGAVYPLRRYTRRGGGFDYTGLTRLPIPAIVLQRRPEKPLLKVFWASSNGALYSTQPVREGLRILDELWLGWEDLAWGWSLEDSGFEQVVVTSAVLDDDYEYVEQKVGPVRRVTSEKPVWYSYYVVRNLLLASRATKQAIDVRVMVGLRFALEIGGSVVFRNRKSERLKLLVHGIVDGLRGRAGKGAVP